MGGRRVSGLMLEPVYDCASSSLVLVVVCPSLVKFLSAY
jgi:hypothetical protein